MRYSNANAKTSAFAFDDGIRIGFLLYWPTVLWALGYLEFWLHLVGFSFPLGISVWVAAVAGIVLLIHRRKEIDAGEILKGPFSFKILMGLCAAILLIALFESRHPPHLIQESDVLVYHMSIPRQHLLHETAGFLPWSIADLFPMPLQWGLAPAWFMGNTITKWPQTVMALWVVFLMIGLGKRENDHHGWIPALALISAHGVMIQLGTAMMDLPILYCAVAGWHGLTRKRWAWAALNLALFATAKSFMPILIGLVLIISIGILTMTRSSSLEEILKGKGRFVFLFLIFTFLLLARSSIVSLQAAGTPLFPFLPQTSNEAIQESAKQHLSTRDAYGNGRGPVALITHVWRVAVPTKGVNNEFDYPLGLPWLLGAFFLIVSLATAWRRKQITPESALALAFWMVWWAGSHQSRWLYPVIAFAWLGTTEIQKMIHLKLLAGVLILSAGFSLISQARSLRTTLFLPSAELQARQEANITKTGSKILYINKPIDSRPDADPLWFIDTHPDNPPA